MRSCSVYANIMVITDGLRLWRYRHATRKCLKTAAQKTVDAALDVLRLFVASVPEWYRRANGVGLPAVTRILMTDEKGCIQPFTVWTGQGAPAGSGSKT